MRQRVSVEAGQCLSPVPPQPTTIVTVLVTICGCPRFFFPIFLGDLDNLPEPDDIAEEIVENLEAGLESFRRVLSGL